MREQRRLERYFHLIWLELEDKQQTDNIKAAMAALQLLLIEHAGEDRYKVLIEKWNKLKDF